MARQLSRLFAVLAALVLPAGAALLASSSPAGASLPSTLTFGSGSVLHVRIGILTVTVDLATGVDGTDTRGSVAVTVTGSHFASATPFGAPGNTNDSQMDFPTGSIVGTLTGTAIVGLRFVTATGTSPKVTFSTSSLQNCEIDDAYTEVYAGTTGNLTATTGASTYRTHASAGSVTGATCSATLVTYLNTYSATAKVSGTVTVM